MSSAVAIGCLPGRTCVGAAMGAGAQVFVRGGRLMARILTPVPALLRGLPLDPDDETTRTCSASTCRDSGCRTVRIVFGRDLGAAVVACRPPGQPLSLHRQRPTAGARGVGTASLGVLAGAAAAMTVARCAGHARTGRNSAASMTSGRRSGSTP